MMLGVSASQIGHNNNNNNTCSVRGADGGAVVAASAEAQESGGTSGGSCGDVGGATTPAGIFMGEEAEKSGGGGGNRWPRQETLALLKIRSDMDLTFRDSSLKGPLWDEVSRKMAELGYHRNPKKCKEKFENVYKYHKRTKEGRSSKSDGKTYRFFDQLQALENIGGAPPPQQPPPPPPLSLQLPPPPRPLLQTMAASVTMAVPIQVVQPTPSPPQVPSPHQQKLTVSSTPQNTTISFNNPFASSFPQPSQSPHPPPQPPTVVGGNAVVPPNFMSHSPSLSSSSTSSDEEPQRRDSRKRKYKDLFESLMQNVVEKQENMQKKFLETLEKRERDRIMREEAWRNQEMARLQKEHDHLVQERSMAAERESALISLLQKLTENQQNQKQSANNQTALSFGAVQIPEKPVPRTPTPTPPPPLPPPHVQQSAAAAPHVPAPPVTTTPVMAPQFIRTMENSPRQENTNNSGGLEAYNTSSATSSRWPKAEIDALINLRTHLDNKYQENGPKGPLWEEISAEMKKLGYSRNAKRCKEKWENINKYYKKVKESNKRRPEDSKTCPYFHQLDALYREKEKSGKPENSMMPIMARPEQQWPFPQQQSQLLQQQQAVQLRQQQQQEHAMDEQEGENNEDEYDDEDDEGEDDDDEGSAYEIVTNKQPSSVTSTS